MNSSRSKLRLVPLAGAIALLAGPLAGCSAVTEMLGSGDAWAITYEVSLDGGDSDLPTGITYLDTRTRSDAQTTEQASMGAPASGDGASPWSIESIVRVGDLARVSAEPPAGTRATCRILIDGTREIASETGEAGAPVRCEARAPKFAE